jgi:hypothetical protein
MKIGIKISRLVGIALVGVAVGCAHSSSRQPVYLNQTQFTEAFRSNWITRAQIVYDPQSFLREVHGRMLKPEGSADVPFIAKVRLTEKLEKEMLASGRFEVKQGR